jgi:surface antigen
MMKLSTFYILSSILLASCTLTTTNPQEQGPKQAVGTVTGMILGGKVANDFSEGSRNEGLWTMAGVALGAFLGNEVGASMDRQDALLAERATIQALEYSKTEQVIAWKNPDSGNYGTVYPTNTSSRNGQPCREFTQEINIGGNIEQAFGKACRNADGSWDLK